MISFVFFSLPLLSFCLFVQIYLLLPKLRWLSFFPFLFARYKYVILFVALKQLLTISPLYYISRDKYASAHNQAIMNRLILNAQLTEVLAGFSDDSFKRKFVFFKVQIYSQTIGYPTLTGGFLPIFWHFNSSHVRNRSMLVHPFFVTH